MNKIKTNYKSFKKATEDLANKINKAIEDMGDKVTFKLFEDHGEIYMDSAFEASLGFTDGSGLYGHEGFGDCGPYVEDDLPVFIEPINSVTVGIYKN